MLRPIRVPGRSALAGPYTATFDYVEVINEAIGVSVTCGNDGGRSGFDGDMRGGEAVTNPNNGPDVLNGYRCDAVGENDPNLPETMGHLGVVGVFVSMTSCESIDYQISPAQTIVGNQP